MTPFEEAITEMHEWYRSMVTAGFTADEALTIIAKCLTENAGKE